MLKPNNYDNIKTFGEFTPLELGGHILVIKKVVESKTTQGKDMVTILFDTHTTDKQPNFYTEQYKRDTRPKAEKKWGGFKIEFPYKANGDVNPFFKVFTDSVAKSNNGWQVQWDKEGEATGVFANCFVGKLVGGVFGKEEYLYNGEKKMGTKCVAFRSVEAIKAGVQVPKDNLLSGSNDNEDLIPIDDGDMPF